METQEYEFFVADACGTTALASFSILIVDETAPSWDDPSLSLTLDAECGDDIDALLAANLPTATDACGIANVTLDNAASGTTCGNASVATYTYAATDACGNTNADLFTITVNITDTQAPVFTGVPNDMTIGCDDPYPNEATLFANLAATDACDGDLTGAITILPPGTIVGCVPTPLIEYNYQFSVIDGCGNETIEDFTIFVTNDLSVDLGPDQTICGTAATLDAGNPGRTYEWSTGETTQTIEVTTAGTYSVTVSGGNGCCAIDEVVISAGAAPDAMATGGTLTCATGTVQLMGSSTTPGVSYSWTGPNGFTSNAQNPTVTMAGTYTLTVSSADGCAATADATVTQDANVPDVSTAGGTITCAMPMITLTASSTTPGVTFEWTDPDGNTSAGATLADQTLVGTYTVAVTAPNGCTAMATAEVLADNANPSLTATGGMLDCTNNSIQLMATAIPAGGNYSWVGPNGFSSNEQNPIVTMMGDYTVTYTAANGCSNTATATVSGNTDAPDAMATGGQLDCASTGVTLMGSSTTPGVSYSWTGPNGFSSNEQNPNAVFAGTYTLTVTAPNGCTATATATVTEDSNVPDASATGGVIGCGATSVQLMGSSTTPGVTYSWTGPNGFSSNEQNPTVMDAGTYTLAVVAPNGCNAFATATVTIDNTTPDAMATGGTLDCITGNVQLMGSSATPGVTYSWTGPNGFSSNEQNPMAMEAGTYTLTVLAANGCTATADTVVNDNPGTAPGASFASSVNDLAVSFADNSTGAPSAWAWDFGDGQTSTEQNPTHNYITPGTYTVCLTVTNDCGVNTSCETITVDVAGGGAVTFNIGTVTGQPGEIIQIPVSVENFTNVVSFQKSIHVADPAVARLVSVTDFNLEELDPTDFNVASDETITSVWFNATDVTVPDGTIIYMLNVELLATTDQCTAVFIDGMPTFIEVAKLETDGSINSVPYVINAGEACILAKVDISGKVYRETGDPL